MIQKRWSSLAAAMLLTGLALMSAARAEGPDSESWLMILRLQLQQSHNCNLDRVLYVRELKLGDDVGLEGRVRCIEGREYDFTRQRLHQKFDIHLCQPAVC